MRSSLSIAIVAFGGLLMLACGGSGSDGPPKGGGGTGGAGLSCETLVPAPEGCDDLCPNGSDSECMLGTHCLNGTCAAQCTATQGCAVGASCNVRGRCVPNVGTGGTGGSGNTNGCQSVTITPTRSIPNVMFLVDQSGSMDANFGSGLDRWEAARAAIVGIVQNLESIVRFGLTTYHSLGGGAVPSECPVFPTEVSISLDNFSSIEADYPESLPADSADTPTGESIDRLVGMLQSNAPPSDGPTIIVVATDGEPDTCAVPNPQNGQGLAIGAATASHLAGFDLFILSVGATGTGNVSAEHLKRMANVGIGLDETVGLPLPIGEDPANPAEGAPFWVGDDPDALSSAFSDIISASISCDIQMDKRFDDKDKACNDPQSNVRLNNVPLSCPSEWRVKPGADDVIELVGAACTTFKTEASTFSATFPCGAIVVE